jgi:hypothetical protein
VREGFSIARDGTEASIGFRVDRRTVTGPELPPGTAGTYLLEVTKGKLAGKRIESLDAACRDMPERPEGCHADTFLRELQDDGVLPSAARQAR